MVAKWTVLLLPALIGSHSALGDDDFRTTADHPRLLLKPQRIRLLKRERERQSPRWIQFEALTRGKAQFPEPGFARALFHHVAEDKDAGREAAAWAAGPGLDVRQLALVYDWCQAAMEDSQKRAIKTKLERALAGTPRGSHVADLRSRIFAAIALDHDGSHAPAIAAVVKIWRTELAPALKQGRRNFRRDEVQPLYELLHAVRDNFNVDLREDAAAFFKIFPSWLLLGYYPAVYPAAENEYRIPAFHGSSEPDLGLAALARAADLSIVAFDTNALESQYLQGWLLNDRFMMKGTFGCVYEFLWANPYQPGLSYHHMPLRFHDPRSGTVFVRSSWEEDARWFGHFEGKFQVFEEGAIQPAAAALRKGVDFGEIKVVSTAGPSISLSREKGGPRSIFVFGFSPGKSYDIEADDEEIYERTSDSGGVLVLEFTRTDAFRVRVHEPRRSVPPAVSQNK